MMRAPGVLIAIALLFGVAEPAVAAGARQEQLRIVAATSAGSETAGPVMAGTVELTDGVRRQAVRAGERFGKWTVMSVTSPIQNDPPQPRVVLEDFTRVDGHVLFVGSDGVQRDFPKAAESTAADPRGQLLGHAWTDVAASATDLLGRQILAGADDPDYATVAAVFAPIRKISGDTYDFLGTPDTFDKVWFNYGGRSPNFDPAIYEPSVAGVRERGNVLAGLVGGWLPVQRWVYPDAQQSGAWTEMLAFAPFRKIGGNDRIQPVWYRVSRVENGAPKWIRYVDTYVAFPMRAADDARLAPAFYADLAAFDTRWTALVATGMTIDLPDKRVENMARFALVRAIMTRIGDFPKYGVLDRNYGGAEHDGFPDTFTVETTAMLDWGLIERAGRIIDNYLRHFVRDDGSLVYRGPETGQYGRMLTVAATYAHYGGDASVLLANRKRLDAIADLLLALRAKAQELPPDSAAYGMIAAWSEADSVLEPDPERYMQPYFSNSAEAARGFIELGAVWQRLGEANGDAELAARGKRLRAEGESLRADVQTSIARSLLRVDGETILPAIAGAKEPFHVAVARDGNDPQYRSYRAWMEMIESGVLDDRQIGAILDYRERHHDVILGMPTAYGYAKGEMAGFLAYGHGLGLVQTGRIREALLMLYSNMAHQYTRGTWLAPETRRLQEGAEAAPYCTPAQLVVALMTRWLIVLEDPDAKALSLGKGIPRDWLADGKTVSVRNAPTRWGPVGYRIDSHVDSGSVHVRLTLPEHGLPVETRLSLRVPGDTPIARVVDRAGRDVALAIADGVITIPANSGGEREFVVRYAPKRSGAEPKRTTQRTTH